MSFLRGVLLKIASWSFRQSLGSKKGAAAVAHAAPVLSTIADAAGQAAVVQINKAAAAGGDVAKVAAAVQAAQALGVIK